MKLSHLKQILAYIQNFTKISAIYRVSDTIVKISFDKDEELYFEMRRSDSFIFKTTSYSRSKIYNAPFDVLLSKRFNRSNILSLELINEDKIIRFKTSLASAYEQEITYLQFEFTGKYTNVIILDENFIVLEALRHVDLFSSFREVRVGQKLLDIPTAPFVAKEYPIENIEHYLYAQNENEQNQKLTSLKKQKIAYLTKKLSKLEKLYNSLENEEKLYREAELLQHYGNLVLSNIHLIKPYQSVIVVNDYDSKEVSIELLKAYPTVSMMSNSLFSRSKKAKQKAKYLHIEKSSLESKIEHIQLFINTVKEAESLAKMNLLFPKTVQAKKIKHNESVETFLSKAIKCNLEKMKKGISNS